MIINNKSIAFWLKLILIFNLSLFTVVLYFNGFKNNRLHVDEYSFIRKSYFFDLFFIKNDFKNPCWLTDEFTQPRLGPYIYGLTLHFYGIKDIEQWQKESKFNDITIIGEKWHAFYFWKPLENFPPDLHQFADIIYKARTAAVLFTFGTFILIFSLGLLAKNFLFSLVGIFMLSTNWLIYYYGSVAMTDAFQLFFFMANLLLIYRYGKIVFKPKNQNGYLWISLAIGINAAFATSVKVIGILALLFFVLSSVIFIMISKFKRNYWCRWLISNVIVISSFFLIFIFLNPQLYRQPFLGSWQMFSNRWEGAKEYQRLGIGEAIYNKTQAVKYIIDRLLLTHNLYGNFSDLPFADIILLAGGLIILGKIARQKWRQKKEFSIELILILWWLVTLTSLVFYLKNDWDRYYLPLEAAITLVQSYFLAYLLTLFGKILAKNFLYPTNSALQ